MSGVEATTTAFLLGEPLPVELMNTVRLDRDGAHDALETDAQVAAWLRAVGGRIDAEAGVAVQAPDVGLESAVANDVRDLRDALRSLAAEVTEDPRPPVTPRLDRPEAIAKLNALARTWPELAWSPDGEPARTFRAAGSAADLAVGLIAHQGVELLAGAGRERLRACLAPNCPLFFSKERTRREWCSAECGNRARVARHYQRQNALPQN